MCQCHRPDIFSIIEIYIINNKIILKNIDEKSDFGKNSG